MNNINELIERAHSQAKAMGWWDDERNTGELLMLIVSECGEALEAHRMGKRADLVAFEAELRPTLAYLNGDSIRFRQQAESSAFKEVFLSHIKDTFEDELADIVIRIADYMGHLGVRSDASQVENDILHELLSDNIGECLFAISGCLHKYWSSGNAATSLDPMIEHVFALARKYNIDLWKHVDLKLAYNLTRGQKHGKAY